MSLRFRSVVVVVIAVLLTTTAAAAASGPRVDQGSGAASSGSSSPTEEAAVASISYELNRSLTVNETSSLQVTVQAKKSIEDATLAVAEPFGFDVAPTTASIGDLDVDETTTIELSVTPSYELVRNLELTLSGNHDGTEVRQSSVYELAVNPSGTSTHGTTINESDGETGAVGDGGDTGFSARSQVAADSSCSQVSLSGTGEYTAGGETHAMANPVVEIWDDDSGSDDDLVAEQNAAANGSFSFCVSDSDSDGSGTLDPYVAIYAKNPAAQTATSDGVIYFVVSSTESNVSDGESITFGTDVDGDSVKELVPSTHNPAWQSVDWSMDERRVVRQATADNWTRPRVTIFWPAGDWPVARYRYDTGTGEFADHWMELPSKSTASWDSNTVYHEYGHMVMYSAYDTNHFTLPPSDSYELGHCVWSETDPGFAMTEGWAEFMSVFVTGDPTDLSDLGQDIETNQWYDSDADVSCVDGDTTGEMDGHRVEGSAASILFDLTDSGNAEDESMSGNFDAIFSIIRNDHPQNITHFYDLWDGGNRDELDRIYTTYGVDTVSPSVEITSPSSTVSNSTVRFEGTANDTHSNVSSVELRVDDGEWRAVSFDNGIWTDERNLTEGDHTMSVRAVDASNNTASANRSFSVDLTATANVSLTEYSVSATSVLVDQSVTVTATVENTGGETGETNVTLVTDGTAESTKSVSVKGGSSQTVSFETSFGTVGTHNVTVQDDSTTLAATDIEVDNESTITRTLELQPNAVNATTGQDVTFEIVLTDVTAGVGGFNNLTVTSNETAVAELTSISTDIASGANTGIVSNGSEAFVNVPFGGDTADTGDVTLATVTVTAAGNGTASLNLSLAGSISDEQGSLYEIDSVEDATINATAATGPPPVVGSDAPTDVDDDGAYEDVNGNGRLDIGDVQAMFANQDSETVQNNVAAFDFNGNGGIDIGDVQALFAEL